jgi:hypothetical protein
MAMLRGELDRVVMKCLEKHRERRYETASGLARDIDRYLADLPVEARPPSARYRLGKFLKRNVRPVLAASLLLLALIGGVAGTTFGLIRAEAARAVAEKLAEGERLAKLAALAAKEKAVTAEKAEAEQRARAVAERDRAEASLYVNQIYLAQRCWLAENVQHADRLLAATPKPLRNWEWGYLTRTLHPELLTLPGNGQFTMRLAFNRDGNRMAAFAHSGDAGAVVWDRATARPLCEINGGKPGINRSFTAGDLSPDGATLAMGDANGGISLWDADTGKFRCELGKLKGSVSSIAFSPDGRSIAAARTDPSYGSSMVPVRAPDRHEQLCVIEIASGKPVFSPAGGVGVDASFSPDGKHLLTFKKNRRCA